MWANLGLRKKVFVFFSLLALLPLTLISIIWVRSAYSQLRTSAESRQTILSSGTAQRLSEAVAGKVLAAVARSQESSVISFDIEQAKINLIQYANQDTDVRRIALADVAGDEKLVIENRQFVETYTNIKGTNEFEVISRLSNASLQSAVTYDKGEPVMSIAVPIFSLSKLGDQNLSPAEAAARRFGSDTRGVLVVTVSLKNLFGPLVTTSLGDGGYMYLVSADGRLIAHPDSDYLAQQPVLDTVSEVSAFIQNVSTASTPRFTQSEKGTSVLSQYHPVASTGWGLISQEPEASIYAAANQVVLLVVGIIGVTSVLVLLLSLLFSGTLTKPIQLLVGGTSQLGEGNFDMRVPVQARDEIGVLAERFNTMADKLKQLIVNLQTETIKLNVVLNSVNEGIIATNAVGTIVHANMASAVLLGAVPAAIHNRNFDDLFKLEHAEQPFLLNRSATAVYGDLDLFAPDGSVRYVDIFVTRIEGDKDGISNIITIRDKTDERELEKMKFDFVSMAAHELRTPITAIRGYLHLLAADRNSTLSPQSHKSVDRAQASTRQLVGLINNLLNVSKIERGSLDMSFAKVDWVRTVHDVMNDQQFSAEEKSITLSYEGPIGDIYLYGDDLALKEVLNNLITNALRYTPRYATVVVSVRTEADQVITAVKDPGIGIPATAMSRLFTKFFRVKGVIESGSAGTGLGLYITKSIVELHQGKIWCESEEGKGATFTFSLPVYDVQYHQSNGDNEDNGVKKSRGWITKNITR